MSKEILEKFPEILKQNRLPMARFLQTICSLPKSIYFLQEEFIRHYAPFAQIPPERVNELVNFAPKIETALQLKLLAWHIHLFDQLDVSFQPHPVTLPILGNDSGKFYMLIALGMIPDWEHRAKYEDFPIAYARNAAKRIGTTAQDFVQFQPQNYGLSGAALPFLRHYYHSNCFRIGRFDFILGHPDPAHPELFKSSDQLIALCRPNWPLDAQGFVTASDSPNALKTTLEFSSHQVTGYPIDLECGQAKLVPITLDLPKFKRLTAPEDFIAVIHIPSGEPLELDTVQASFQEAQKFFRDQFPHLTLRAFFSISWLFSPDWARELPNSRLARLFRATKHFPGTWNPHSGERFVFGVERDNPDAYPQDNSLRRAMVKILRERGFLRSGGLIVLPNELEK